MSKIEPQARLILAGTAITLSIAMGLRQSIGLFMPEVTRELGISVSDFTLAIAMQNLAWGLGQPVVGALVPRIGFRPILVGTAGLYVLGMACFALAQGQLGVMLGAGILMGLSLAGTASAMAMAVASRPVPLAVRSTVLGVVSAAGSMGAMIAAPIGQALLQGYGWRAGVWGFAALAALMIPSAFLAARVDRVALPTPQRGAEQNGRAVMAQALRSPRYMVMVFAYSVCGLQLVFLTTHLPSYLTLCGLDPMLGAQALATIGAFNVLGSLAAGWAGQRASKPLLLGCIYTARSLTLLWYFATPPSPASTLVFAAMMGFLWLGVAPLMAGAVGEMYGLRWQPMLQGVAFMSHQIGSFLGAFGGGLLFDWLGDYTLAVQLGVGMGLCAGLAQIGFSGAWPGRPRARVA
ncbi:MFS transporter [Rhodovarius lipocyclicus]|uniref:MFS transporter n=1 Tax=Rhodovarius lipocyclicus TaxID=268410 RepID=UPI00191712AE|nr:MFS transporter [Rhodovarius lipocyclicus]